MELDEICLLSGVDIPFEQGNLIIHQPAIKDIAFLGEENFFIGCQMITACKKFIDIPDKSELNSISNFDILMMAMNEKDVKLKKQQQQVQEVLSLVLPQQMLNYTKDVIECQQQDDEKIKSQLTRDNFNDFCRILIKMFCLKDITNAVDDYNPVGKKSAAIAEQLRKRHKKLAQLKNEKDIKKVDVLSRYISILSVGMSIPISHFINYTVFQLHDNYNRQILKMKYDVYLKSVMAGNTKAEEPEDWM